MREPLVRMVPVGLLKMTLGPLRGAKTHGEPALAPLPLRVAELPDGSFEVLDGFKRLLLWKDDGHVEVPVVVEPRTILTAS